MGKKSEELTGTRGGTHGDFEIGASITQGIMGILGGSPNWTDLRPAQREAIHMIVHKIHRIVSGDPNHPDHWDDIEGYAALGAPSRGEVTMAPRKAAKPQKAAKKAAKKVAKAASKSARKVSKAPKAAGGGRVLRDDPKNTARRLRAQQLREEAAKTAKKAGRKAS